MKKEVSLRDHLRKAAKTRWAGKTSKERSEHAAMMNSKRWSKKKVEPSEVQK